MNSFSDARQTITNLQLQSDRRPRGPAGKHLGVYTKREVEVNRIDPAVLFTRGMFGGESEGGECGKRGGGRGG